jgi:transcriptional regulator with XRE-family HTH domain
MRRQGVSQAGLARQLQVSGASVSAWVSGSKRPTTDNLIQIAEFLGVSPGYLQFGDVDLTVEGLDVEGARAEYKDSLSWYWRPAPRDHGREYGNAAGYAFEPDIGTLARESGQNICDEKLEAEPTVEARYTVAELSGDELEKFLERIRFQEVREHLEAASRSNLKAGSVISRGLEQLDSGALTFIKIEDFHAHGLTGPEFQPGRFMAVVRNVLDSQKNEGAGGSFGLGKATLWSSSQFGLVLVNSNLSEPVEGRTEGRLIGRIDLPWHQVDGQEWAGPGWFGVPDPEDDGEPPARTISYWGNRAAASDLLISRPAGVAGTSFLIVGAYDASGAAEGIEEIAERLSETLADNFWPAMVDRSDDEPARFRAIVRAERNGKLVSESYVNPAQFQAERVSALLKHVNDDVVDQLDKPGDLVRRHVTLRIPRRTADPEHGPLEHEATLLVVQAEDEIPTRSATASGFMTCLRGSHMVIQSSKVGAQPVGARSFHAIVLAGEASGDEMTDRAADRFLRAAEPPAHNKWTGTPDLTASYVRGGRAAIEAFDAEVKRLIREIIKQPSRDLSDGPESLKELLRIVPPKHEGKRPRVRSIKDHEVDENGAWVISDATLSLPPRSDGRGWTVRPVLRFGTESGSALSVDWIALTPLSNCELDEENRLVIPAKARTARFSAVSDPSTHPVGARRAKVLVDVRVYDVEVTQ